MKDGFVVPSGGCYLPVGGCPPISEAWARATSCPPAQWTERCYLRRTRASECLTCNYLSQLGNGDDGEDDDDDTGDSHSLIMRTVNGDR